MNHQFESELSTVTNSGLLFGGHRVISGFIRSLVLNISTLAPRDGWSGALYSLLCANDCDFVV